MCGWRRFCPTRYSSSGIKNFFQKPCRNKTIIISDAEMLIQKQTENCLLGY